MDAHTLVPLAPSVSDLVRVRTLAIQNGRTAPREFEVAVPYANPDSPGSQVPVVASTA